MKIKKLNESTKFKVNDKVFVKPNKKQGRVLRVKGDYITVEMDNGKDPIRIDTYYDTDLEAVDKITESKHINESVLVDDEVVIGLYGDELKGGLSSLSELQKIFRDNDIKIKSISGDTEYGWDLEVMGNARDIHKIVNKYIPGYDCASTQEFVDRYELTESKPIKERISSDDKRKALAEASANEKSIESFLTKFGFNDERYPHIINSYNNTEENVVSVSFSDGINAKDYRILKKNLKDSGASDIYLAKRHIDSSKGNELWSTVEFEFINKKNEGYSFEDGGPFWYLSKHGLGPGMLPKGVNVVDTIEDDNFNTYIALDKVLSTQELKDYELKEKKPPMKEARRKASDPKQIEKAEKAMFDSLMNGASNTEWMISDAKMIYGLSYNEAMKAFRNAHNKFMLQKHTLEEDSDTYYVTIYEEDQRYNPEEGGYVSTGWSASKSKQFKDKESALKYQQEFIEGADILNVDEEDNIIHIKDEWNEEYLVAVEDSASRGKSDNPAKSWAEAELYDIEQPKKVFFDDNGNRVARDPKEVEAERKELEDKFNLFKDEISKANDVKSIMHIAYDEKFGKIRHRKHDEYWNIIADRISEIKKSMNESSNANENYWFEDDGNFFNKEEILEFGDEIVDRLNKNFDSKWELTGAYEDGNEIEIEVSSDDVGTYVHSVKVDFRRIKKPSDINKYIMAFVAKFSEQIRKDTKDMMLNESLGGKYAKKILEFAKRSLDNHYDITGILEIVLRYCPEDILRDAWHDKIRFLIDDTDDSDLLDDNDSKLIESASEDIPTETLAGPEEGPKAGLAELISMAIKDEWDAIETYNTLSITARAEGFEDIATISDEIGTEENKHVGQLQAALKTISPNAEAIDVGEEEGNNQLEG